MLVLIGRGPMGSGMEETYQITSALKFLKWGREVAVVTDARFSGVSTGACIGHVGPEALAGGPIGKVRDGDLIRIVVDRNELVGTRRFRRRTATAATFTPAEGAASPRRRDRRAPTSPPTRTCPTTRASGPPCNASAAAPGAAACTTSSESWRRWKRANALSPNALPCRPASAP